MVIGAATVGQAEGPTGSRPQTSLNLNLNLNSQGHTLACAVKLLELLLFVQSTE